MAARLIEIAIKAISSIMGSYFVEFIYRQISESKVYRQYHLTVRKFTSNSSVILPGMNVILGTERLLLRTFTEDEGQLIYHLNIDPDVTRYSHDPVRDFAHVKEILTQVILPKYTLYNHGRWAVHLRESLEFIGWCGLKYRTEEKEIDLGYRVQKNIGARGYATEAAFASIKFGFQKLNISRIVGRAEPDNIASCKVLEKC